MSILLSFNFKNFIDSSKSWKSNESDRTFNIWFTMIVMIRCCFEMKFFIVKFERCRFFESIDSWWIIFFAEIATLTWQKIDVVVDVNERFETNFVVDWRELNIDENENEFVINKKLKADDEVRYLKRVFVFDLTKNDCDVWRFSIENDWDVCRFTKVR